MKALLKKANKSIKQAPRLYIEVLQNGATLVNCSHKLRRAESIYLSASKGLLKVPFYPLSGDVEVVRIENNTAYLKLTLQSEGFVASKSQFRVIRAHQKENLEPLKLKDGDYGAVNYYGLKILFRLSSKDSSKNLNEIAEKKLKPIYRGTPQSFIYHTPRGHVVAAASVLIATIIMGALTFGFLSRSTHFAMDKESLPAVYKLPFVSDQHLKILPEVLQNKLIRPEMLNQAIVYYREFASVLSGDIGQTTLVNKDTRELYKNIYKNQEELLAEQFKAQTKLDAKSLTTPGSAVVMVPAIHGESFDHTSARILNKLALHDKVHEYNLDQRRRNTLLYTAEKENSYSFQDYKNKGGQSAKDKKELQESLAKIKPFHLMSDEEAMYYDANKLADMAKSAHRHVQNSAHKINETHSKPELSFTPPFASATFIAPPTWHEVDVKFSQLVGSEFGIAKRDVVKEPLIGQLDPKLIERVISQRKFELQLCYDVALRRNQAINGTMAWQWRLDSRGILTDLTLLNSEIKDDRMIDCVRERITRWRFPRPTRGSVEIQYPFTFRKARG